MEEKAIRKRPMFMIACVFTAGTILAEEIFADGILTENHSGREFFPVWIFPVILLLIALAVSIRPLRLHHYFRTVLWNLLILVVFAAAVIHSRNAITYRQAYLTQLAEGETVTVYGRLDRKEYKNDRFRYYLTDTSVRIGQEAYPCNSVILYYDTDNNCIGDSLLVTGEVYLYAEATNEGMFDLRAYYQSQKIDFALFPEETEVIRQVRVPWKEGLWKLRNRLETALQQASDLILFSSTDSGLMTAMILGDKSSMDEEVKSLYQDAGISHILAISGLHISILGMSLYHFLKKRGAGFVSSGILAGTFLFFYAQMTGCAVSTERAVGMVLLTMTGAAIGRQTDMLNSLGAMVLFLLWNNPFLTGNSGFVFTVAAILGITVTGAVLTEGMAEKRSDLVEEVRQEDEKIREHLEEWWTKRSTHENGNVWMNGNKYWNKKNSYIWKGKVKKTEKYERGMGTGKFPFGREDLPLLMRAFHVRKQKLMKCTLPESLLSGLAITLTTLPIVARYYFQIPVYSFLLNLLVLPLTGTLMISGVCGMLAAVISPGAGALLLTPASVILRIYTGSCQVVMEIPGALVITGEPALGRILLYYILLGVGLAAIHERNRRREREEEEKNRQGSRQYYGGQTFADTVTGGKLTKGSLTSGNQQGLEENLFRKKWTNFSGNHRKILAAGSTILVLIMVLLLPISRGFELDILDVGQGDGIFLRTEDNVTCFWDGGSTSEEEIGTYRILPFLKSKGIQCIDYWFVTHSDTDHVSGLKEILEDGYPVRNLVISAYMPQDSTREELEALALANQTNVLCMNPGDCIQTKTAVLTCLYPDEEAAEQFEDVNNLSLTMLYEEDGFSGIFAGDIPEEAEELLVEEMKNAQEKEEAAIYDRICNITFYKVNHHGSKYSSSTEFMEVLSPDLAAISCGINNRYGHPAAEAIERIEETGCQIFYTMYSGEIKITRRKGEGKISVKTFQ